MVYVTGLKKQPFIELTWTFIEEFIMWYVSYEALDALSQISEADSLNNKSSGIAKTVRISWRA